MDIDVIRPEIFQAEKQINAFVTLKNGTLSGGSRQIEGLNLGFNTLESPEIVTQNRRALTGAFGLSESRVAFANQVHSNRVDAVNNGGIFPDTDGLITQIPGLALTIQIADCAAVLIADTTAKTIAAVHAGWRGAASDIVPRAMEKMGEFGAKTERCKAFISPCICVDHFEVGEEVAEQFPDHYIDFENYKKPHVDLKGLLQYQLQQGGIRGENIEAHPGCTVAEKQYYSYRREGKKSGRMMAVIQLGEGSFY